MMYAQQTPQQAWRSRNFAVQGSNARPAIAKQQMAGAEEEEEEVEGVGNGEYTRLREVVERYHTHAVSGNECCSLAVQRIEAPVSVVWSLVRRFDEPQAYKHFVRSCFVQGDGDLKVGCLRQVRVVSGLPAATSTERLEILDEERHILSFRIVGGDHRLNNYRSVTTLHEVLIGGCPGTVVVESYVVDVPDGNTKDDTCLFINTIVKCNLQSLAQICQHLKMDPHAC